jgi:type VI secretion system secreted protein Hcp
MKAPIMAIAVLALVLWGAASSSWAAVDAFIWFENVKGESQDARHKDWIEISSFQWGVGRGISSPSGGRASRESSAPSVSEIVVTKHVDSSSPKLSQLFSDGHQAGQRAIIAVRKAGGKQQDFLTISLYNVLIGLLRSSTGGDRPTESLSLNFTKIEWTYAPQHTVNGSPGPLTGGWVPTTNQSYLVPAVQVQHGHTPATTAAMGDGSVRWSFPQVWRQIQMDLRR